MIRPVRPRPYSGHRTRRPVLYAKQRALPRRNPAMLRRRPENSFARAAALDQSLSNLSYIG